MISQQKLLNILEKEHLALTTNKRSGERIDGPVTDLLDTLKDEFRRIIDEAGAIESKKQLKDFCNKLDIAQLDIAVGAPTEVLDRLTKLRNNWRKRLSIAEGWMKEPPFTKKGITPTGMRGLEQMLLQLGKDPLLTAKDGELSPEELATSLAIASILGEVAVADFWSVVKPDKFAFNNRTIQNLRDQLGVIETYRGNPLVDVPVQLLTLPSLACLRQLFFNRMRDKYEREIYRTKGGDAVIAELLAARRQTQQSDRQRFIDELIDHFGEADTMPVPGRLRDSLEQGTLFPARHQRIDALEIEKQRQMLIAHKTGGGKTASSITAFERLRDMGKAKRALIVCPKNITNVWLSKLTDENGGYFKKKRKPNVVVISSDDPDRAGTWEKAKNADYVIMGLGMVTRKTNGKSHVEMARELGADFFVLDEAHNVRKPMGKLTEAVYQITQCDSIREGYTVLSTATPVFNTIRDIAAQLRLLNAGQARLQNVQGIPQNVDFTNILSLSRAIARNHTRLVRNLLLLRMRNLAVDDSLPVGTELTVEEPKRKPLSPMERIPYDAEVDYPMKNGSEALQALERICMESETKYQQILEDCIESIERKEKKVLAHSGFAKGVTRDRQDRNDPDLSDIDEYIAGRLRRDLGALGYPLYILDGYTGRAKNGHGKGKGKRRKRQPGELEKVLQARKKLIEDFGSHPDSAFLCMLLEVGGEGISITDASDLTFIDPSSVKTREEQGIGRVHRKGQKKNVHARTLMLENTIEEGKWKYAIRKYRIVLDLLNGKPLTREEESMLNEDTDRIRNESFLAYEALSPRQKVQFIFNWIFGQGKEGVREFFERDGGKYAKDLAELYLQEEDLSFQGNNRRLLLSLLQKRLPELKERFGKSLKLMDVACGTMALARSLEHEKDIDVHSSDISAAMLEVGQRAFDTNPKSKDRVKNCAMDELPYKPGSMHIGVLSLALHYTKHSERRTATGGAERDHSIRKFVTSIAKGGIGYIALPPFLFEDQPEKLQEICDVLEDHYGCDIIAEDTGCARSAEEGEDGFQSYVISFRTARKPSDEPLTPAQWNALNFPKKKKKPKKDTSKPKEPRIPTPPPPGSFHEHFVLGDQRLQYVTPPQEEFGKKEHGLNKKKYTHVRNAVQSLIEKYKSIKDIPAEKLLSISVEELPKAEQDFRDQYFKTLLAQYGNRIERIPIEKISGQSSVILWRGKHKRKGAYLSLANVKEPGKPPTGGYGKRYFVEEEFAKG